ncbi:MAG: metallophosphoesterase [Eubacteriales bacterium]|nr:metallophosphoesterase [Eubacteriales bacterium]
MLWIIIFLVSMTVAVALFAYLVSRISKFNMMKSLLPKKKIWKILCSMGIILLPTALLSYLWSPTNGVVVLIHLGVIWLLCDLVGWMIQKKKPYHGKCYFAGVTALVTTFAVLSCGWYLAHHVWQTDYIVKTDKNVNGLRIVQFADSHVGTTFHADGFAKHMEAIQALQPDVVLITGDFVDDSTTREDMIASCAALGTLHPTYGVYFSFGNHDKGYYGEAHRGYNAEDLIDELEKNGVHVLQDEVELIRDEYYIIGRQDYSEEQAGNGRKDMDALLQGLDPQKYMIVMDHQPHDYENQQGKVDLVLSGHTHGGQFFPITYVGEWIGENDRTYGFEEREKSDFIVTSGISDWEIKFKTGCKSEYVVIDIE